MAKNAPGVLETYTVVYKGGLGDLPKSKAAGIKLLITDDAFIFEPTTAAKKFWPQLTIPYAQVSDISIVARQVSTVEGLLGGINSRQLNQDNNIHFTYADDAGSPTVLRVEMLTGITVMGQAGKAREFQDRLRTFGILDKLAKTDATTSAQSGDGIPEKIMKLAELHAAGILTDEEFAAKKTELLAQM